MSADLFVYLDTVQFSKNGVQNRNLIRSSQGPIWLTVPVRHRLGQTIRETELADRKAIQKHWKTLVANYARTPGFQRWAVELRELFHTEWSSLVDLAIASTSWMLQKLGIVTPFVRAGDLTHEGKGSQLIASLCHAVGATVYLTGKGALDYLDPVDFQPLGCQILVQGWREDEGGEQGNKEEEDKESIHPDLSMLDLLLRNPDNACKLIATSGSWHPLTEAT